MRIDTPCHNAADYYCYKKFKSITLLAIAGPDCECLWFNVGFPGKAGDARVFLETGLKEFVDGLDPDKHPIGDGAFALSSGLMKPFPYEGSTEEQEYFNFKLSSSRMVIECFFGQLKSRFRCLLRGLQFRSVVMCCSMISSLVLLHNFIVENSSDDVYFDDEIMISDELDNLKDSNEQSNEYDDDFTWNEHYIAIMQSGAGSGTEKRDSICQMLWSMVFKMNSPENSILYFSILLTAI
jgi:hypothetical protein